MNFTCNKEELREGIQLASRAVSTRATMPILSGILIKAEGDDVFLGSTDLELGIRRKVNARVDEGGSTVISARILGDIIKNIVGDEVSLSTSERFMSLSSGEGKFRIREMMPEDFPHVPEWKVETSLTIDGSDLSRGVFQISKASSSDEKRPVLTGSLVEKELESSSLRMVTTDSYRLAVKDLKVEGSLEGWQDCIIPTKALTELARVADSFEGNIEIGIQENQVLFKAGDALISSRLIEGQFPSYRQLVPKGERVVIEGKREELIGALKRASIFGNNVRIEVKKGSLVLKAETPELGDSLEELAIQTEGEEMEAGFNAAYLIDGIAGVEGENCRIKLDEPQRPAIIEGEEDGGFTYILMPVRLK